MSLRTDVGDLAEASTPPLPILSSLTNWAVNSSPKPTERFLYTASIASGVCSLIYTFLSFELFTPLLAAKVIKSLLTFGSESLAFLNSLSIAKSKPVDSKIKSFASDSVVLPDFISSSNCLRIGRPVLAAPRTAAICLASPILAVTPDASNWSNLFNSSGVAVPSFFFCLNNIKSDWVSLPFL